MPMRTGPPVVAGPRRRGERRPGCSLAVPANVAGGETVFPTRGVPGGWRDWWDDPDDHAQLRTRAETAERRLEATAARIGRRWQREITRERKHRERARKRRGGSG
jgi:hypothetical protein